MLILFTGLPGLLHPAVVLSLAALLFVLLRLRLHLTPSHSGWNELSARPAEEKAFIAVFAALSGFYFVLVLGATLAPELSFDALNVHLPYARDAASARKLIFASNNWSSLMPALPLMSYITAFLFSGQNLAKLFNTLSYFACGGVVFFFVRRWWGLLRGTAAATLFWSSPISLYEGTTALIDLPFALYSSVAVFALLEWAERPEPNCLRLSAAALGLALGCKYHAAFWFVPCACLISWHALRVYGWPIRRLLRLLFEYAIVASLLFLPWLLRTWYFTGNPVFPLANSIFKSRLFTPAMEDAARAAYANEGVGNSWLELLRLPWTVSFHPAPFRGTPGAVLFLGTALALARIRSRQIRYGLILAGVYFYTWALTAQEIRYLLPIVPALAMIAVAGFLGTDKSLQQPGQNAAWRKTQAALRSFAAPALLLAGACLALPPVYTRWVKEWTYWHSYIPPFRYLLGKESPEEYLSRDVPSIYIYDFVNKHLSARQRILLLNDHAQFYSSVPTLYSFTVEAEGILNEQSEEGVMRKLKEAGISHVLLNYNGIRALPDVAPRVGAYFFLDRRFQEKYLEPVQSQNNVVLYRVRVA